MGTLLEQVVEDLRSLSREEQDRAARLQRYLRWGLGAILLPLTVVSLAGCLAMVASIAMHPLR
jgi:hypothetical protein